MAKPTKSAVVSSTAVRPKPPPPSRGLVAFAAGADPLAVAPAAAANIASMLAGFVADPPKYDPVVAKALFAELAPRLDAIPPELVMTGRLDMDAACRGALSMVALATQVPGLHARFVALAAAGELDPSALETLKSSAFVTMYCLREATEAGAFKTGAKLPADLDQASATVEREMQTVLEHNLGDHPVHGQVLDVLRPGTSYEDRANDLLGYAKLYEVAHAVVSKDTKYKSTHVADARRLAGEILAALGVAMTPKARESYDRMRRAFTVFAKTYVEVQAAGLYLDRYDPLRDERFPSLYAAGRPGVGQKKGKPAADPAVSMGGPESPPKPPGALR